MADPEPSTPSSTTPSASAPAPPPKAPRTLSCTRCQRLKIKCDRAFPCTNCTKSHVQCVPAVKDPSARRRRFPERELLERLRRYEAMLRERGVRFEGLHGDGGVREGEREGRGEGEGEGEGKGRKVGRREAGKGKGEGVKGRDKAEGEGEQGRTVFKPNDLWQAMHLRFESPDPQVSRDASPEPGAEHLTVMRRAWEDQQFSNEHLLFGSRHPALDLPTLHPEQSHIFRLWQVYLDNVNPILKITHTPTLQSRIIEAVSNLAAVKPAMTALMFSIYSIALLTMTDEACLTMLGSAKADLLGRYRYLCQQALLKCDFLRTNDRDVLTALHLYLLAIRPDVDAQTLNSMLGLAIRLAQRMGLHSEAANRKAPPFEAEMRRRLWWSLALYDARICEMSAWRSVTMVPTWDCALPLNVNDFDLQPSMKEQPQLQGVLTETLFAMVRTEMNDALRNMDSFLDFVEPALKPLARRRPRDSEASGSETEALAQEIEEKYLSHCNPDNPLHFLTLWSARGYLAKSSLMELLNKSSTAGGRQPEEQLAKASIAAIMMLECDTRLLTSAAMSGYKWFVEYQFPFPAYLFLTSEVRNHPFSSQIDRAWIAMGDNYDARVDRFTRKNPFHDFLGTLLCKAWSVQEAAWKEAGRSIPEPPLITRVKIAMAEIQAEKAATEQSTNDFGMNMDDFSMPFAMDFNDDFGGQSYLSMAPALIPPMPGQTMTHLNPQQVDWNAMGWSATNNPSW